MCTKYWLTACSSLPRKKCGQVNRRPAMTIAVDLGRKATKKKKKKLLSVNAMEDYKLCFMKMHSLTMTGGLSYFSF